MTAKGRNIGKGTAAASEGGARYTQLIVLNRVEYPQAGIRAVTRQQHHLYPAVACKQTVDVQKLLHQREGLTRL